MKKHDETIPAAPADEEYEGDIEADEQAYFEAFGFLLEVDDEDADDEDGEGADDDNTDEEEFFDLHGSDENGIGGDGGKGWSLTDLLVIVPEEAPEASPDQAEPPLPDNLP